MKGMMGDSTQPDVVTVPAFWLSAYQDEIDLSWLVGLLTVTPTSIGVSRYARIVWEAAKRREIITAAGVLASSAYLETNSLSEVLETASGELLRVALDETTSNTVTAKEAASAALDSILERHEQGGKRLGLATGYDVVDDKLRGLCAPRMYVMAARPGMGKTALATDVISNVCRAGASVLFFSLEMWSEQVATRMISQQAGVSFDDVNEGSFKEHETKKVMEAAGELSTYKLSIDDTPGITVSQVFAKAQRHMAQHGQLDLIVLDYMQLMGTDKDYSNRVQAVSEMSSGLKALGMKLKVPVLVVSQLSRAVENRANKRPILSDLRDSGQIEQDADVVLFVYRGDYYGLDEEDEFDVPAAGATEVNVAKNRYGAQGITELFFDESCGHFAPIIKGEVVL